MMSRESKLRIIFYLITIPIILYLSYTKREVLQTVFNYYFPGNPAIQQDNVPVSASGSSSGDSGQIPARETSPVVAPPVDPLNKELVNRLLTDIRTGSGQKEFEAVLALAETGDPEIHDQIFRILRSKYEIKDSILRDAFANEKITTTMKWVLETSSSYPYEPLGSGLLAVCAFNSSNDIRKEAFWNLSIHRKGNPNAKRLLLRLAELGRDTSQALNTLKYFQEDKEVIAFIVKRFDTSEYPEWLTTPVVRKTFRKESSDEIYVQDAILKRYTALDRNLLPMLDKALSAMQYQDWAGSEKILTDLLRREPQSIDAVFLLMLTREYQKIAAAVSRGIAGNGSAMICESVAATSAPVSCFTDGSLSISSKNISLPGQWTTAEGSGDGSYNLDRIQIFAQTPDSVLLEDPNSDRCWVKAKDLYISRFVIEDESSGLPVWNIGCFPMFPFTFDYEPSSQRIRLTFYPGYWTLIQNATDHLFGPKHYGHLYELRDAVSKQGLNLEVFYPKIRNIPWGMEVYFDMNKLEFSPVDRSNPVNAETAFGRIDSDYGIPSRDLCGKYPHGPYGMKLCYHRFLTKSSYKRYRAFISEPHDNTY